MCLSNLNVKTTMCNNYKKTLCETLFADYPLRSWIVFDILKHNCNDKAHKLNWIESKKGNQFSFFPTSKFIL